MSDRLLKESDVLRIAFQLPLVVNSAFADAVKALPSADRLSAVDLSSVYSTAYKSGYEKGKADEKRWWSGHCAKCTDADRPQGKWIAKDGVFYCSCCDNDSAGLSEDDVYVYGIPLPNYCMDCGADMRSKIVGKHADFMMIDEACAKGADDGK